MAKDQACKLQILSVKHPELLQVVDTMFEKFATGPQVRRMIERKYHEDVGSTALTTYKEKHWRAHKNGILDRLTTMKAVSKLVGEDGLTAGVNALLWESLQEMSVPQLMAFKKVLNDGQKVELMKKQFALFAKEHRQKMKERRAAEKAAEGEVVEDFEMAQRMVEQAKEIFGIGTTAFPPPAPRLLSAPQEVQPPTAAELQPNDVPEGPRGMERT